MTFYTPIINEIVTGFDGVKVQLKEVELTSKQNGCMGCHFNKCTYGVNDCSQCGQERHVVCYKTPHQYGKRLIFRKVRGL